jgi:hypothetical protein
LGILGFPLRILFPWETPLLNTQVSVHKYNKIKQFVSVKLGMEMLDEAVRARAQPTAAMHPAAHAGMLPCPHRNNSREPMTCSMDNYRICLTSGENLFNTRDNKDELEKYLDNNEELLKPKEQ